MSMRLDAWLVANGLFGGRDTAKQHIEAGEVSVNGKTVKKPSAPVDDGDEVICSGGERYVGRGGYKLEKALAFLEGPLDGVVALDVGASTGGFTDCMLQNGAAKVYAVDVGHDQLHSALRADPRVVCLENTDIRREDMGTLLTERPAFCSVDVSFISLKQVMPAVLPLLSPGAFAVCLIKPQFEAGRSAVGKNGVVKDPAAHAAVLRDLCEAFARWDCGVKALTWSPIRGGEGNIEYLAVLHRGEPGGIVDIQATVREAFRQLK